MFSTVKRSTNSFANWYDLAEINIPYTCMIFLSYSTLLFLMKLMTYFACVGHSSSWNSMANTSFFLQRAFKSLIPFLKDCC